MLFVGLDPGTTVAYAVFNTIDYSITVYSQKEFSIDSLVQKLSKYGIIALIASDKKKIPEFVKSSAIKLGALAYSPKEDLLVKDKIKLTKNMNFSNSHERDALASALTAFEHYKPKIDDINRFLSKNNQLDISEKFINACLKNPSLPYAEILKSFQENHTNKNNTKSINHSSNKQSLNQQFSNKQLVYSQMINKLIDDKKFLANYNETLKKQIIQLKKQNNQHSTKIQKSKSEKELMDLLKLKEKRIHNLLNTINQSNTKYNFLSKKLRKFQQYILGNNEFMFLQHLKDLKSFSEVSKTELNNNPNLLFIDDINVYTDKSIASLSKDNLLISVAKPTRKLKFMIPCIVLYWENNFKDIIDNIAVIKTADFNKKLNHIDDISSIIEEYKINRQKELAE